MYVTGNEQVGNVHMKLKTIHSVAMTYANNEHSCQTMGKRQAKTKEKTQVKANANAQVKS